MKKTYNFLTALFAVCFLLLAAAIVLQSGAALAAAACVLLVWLVYRHPVKKFAFWLFVCSFLLQLAVLMTVHTPVISDFAEQLQAARKLREGAMPYQISTYFRIWPYQTGFVLWEALWLSIWDDPMCLKLVHALLSSGTLCLVYRWLLERVRKPAAQAAAGLLAVFPAYFTLSLVLTNQMAGAFFIVLAVWLLTCRDADRLRFWRWPLAGLSLFVSELLRPEAIVLVLVVAIWSVFSLLRTPKAWKRLVIGLLALCAVYFGCQKGADALFRATGFSPWGLNNPLPEWKLVAGLNPDTGGQWNLDRYELLEATFDEDYIPTEETHRLARELICEELKLSPRGWLSLLHKKLSNLWYYQNTYWPFLHTQDGSYARTLLYRLVEEAERLMFYLALALAALGLKKRREPSELLPYFVVFALGCAFLVIEVQPRYAYLPQIFFFMAAGFGLDRLFGLLESKGGRHATDRLSGDSLLQ